MFSDPAASLYWPPDVARYHMETLLVSSSGWLRSACIVSALFWVAFRAYQVLSQPLDQLVQVLGLEVPVAPLVSLAAIKADGVSLHWKPPDQRASVVNYVVRINGIDVADVAPHDTSITIESLLPDHHYTVRIVTLNSSNFQAPSVPIRLRTLPAHSDHYYNPPAHKQPPPSPSLSSSPPPPPSHDASNPTPVVRSNKGLVDVVTPFVAPAMTREHSNSTASRQRRPETARKTSPASQPPDNASTDHPTDSIRQLTEKLDALRRELDDMHRQMEDEDQDFATQKAVLLQKRDDKKMALKEKEDASRDLRKEVATLERQNASAQARRTQQEKLLRQKEAERKKLKDDVAKWTREAGELSEAAEKLKKERVEYESAAEKRIQDIKRRHADEIQQNKMLEDTIREKGIQIKALEEERRRLEEGQEGGDAHDENADRDEDNRWKMALNLLQQQYAQAWQLFSEAERANHEVSTRLQYLQQRRMSQPHLFTGPPVPDMASVQRNSQPSHAYSMHDAMLPSSSSSSPSPTPGGFVHTSSAPFNSLVATSPPSYASITPYFNPVNGMALPPRGHLHTPSLSQNDLESLTGGAPMSPTAGALLPAGLFGDDLGLTDAEDDDDDDDADDAADDDDNNNNNNNHPRLPQPASLDPSPHLRSVLPGLGAPETMDRAQGSTSPTSPHSPPRSAFVSPRQSAGELHDYPTLENNMDNDRRSIHSTSSSFMLNPSASRFGNLFGLNRQRGKTFSDGSLKLAQSQSLPRQEHDLDAVGSSRRRGSHSEGAWYDAFMRTKTQPIDSSSPKHVATRKRPFNMFGAKGDPWLSSIMGSERPSSPRQGSTKSGEGFALPRPSTESQTRFGWSIDAFGARSSPLGVDWSINNTNTTSWSRMPSRRPSIQHGSSTTNLIHDNLLQDDLLDFPTNMRSPMQAPIGTRPQSSASHMAFASTDPFAPIPPTPPKQLNPAAATFTLGFPLGKKTDQDKAEKAKKAADRAAEKEAKKAEKAEKKEERENKAKQEKAEKAARKARLPGEASSDADLHFSSGAMSPQDSRPSRDTPSVISTADASEASPRESLERSVSQSTSNHDGSTGRESFIQKLSRKGSTTQFLTLGKRFGGKKSDVPGTPDEGGGGGPHDESSGGFFLGIGRSSDSVGGHSPMPGSSPNPSTKSSSGLTWSSIKRMGKGKEKVGLANPSTSASASGHGHGNANSDFLGDEEDDVPVWS